MIKFKNEKEQALYELTQKHLEKGHMLLDVMNSVKVEDSRIISRLYDQFRKEAIYYLKQTQLKMEGELYDKNMDGMASYIAMILMRSIPTQTIEQKPDN